MKFRVSPSTDSHDVMHVYLRDLKPTKARNLLIAARRNMVRAARKLGVDETFNDAMRHRNPGVYAQPIFKAPEVSM